MPTSESDGGAESSKSKTSTPADSRTKTANVSFALGTVPISKLKITVGDDDSLLFSVAGKGKRFTCSEMGGWLYDSKSKKPSVNFEILRELARDCADEGYMQLDDCLPAERHGIRMKVSRVEQTLQQVLQTEKKLFRRAVESRTRLHECREQSATVALMKDMRRESADKASLVRQPILIGIRPVFKLVYSDSN